MPSDDGIGLPASHYEQKRKNASTVKDDDDDEKYDEVEENQDEEVDGKEVYYKEEGKCIFLAIAFFSS